LPRARIPVRRLKAPLSDVALIGAGPDRHKGTVISFDYIRGYGFIKPATGGWPVCILLGDVARANLSAPRPGQTLEYEVSCRAGTMIAINVEAVSS
jgi:cold shock CspA family protein